jgi:hypothetical protein
MNLATVIVAILIAVYVYFQRDTKGIEFLLNGAGQDPQLVNDIRTILVFVALIAFAARNEIDNSNGGGGKH